MSICMLYYMIKRKFFFQHPSSYPFNYIDIYAIYNCNNVSPMSCFIKAEIIQLIENISNCLISLCCSRMNYHHNQTFFE